MVIDVRFIKRTMMIIGSPSYLVVLRIEGKGRFLKLDLSSKCLTIAPKAKYIL